MADTSPTTRREFLKRSARSSAALAVAASVPIADLLAAEHPDAELLELGRQHDLLAAEIDDLDRQMSAEMKSVRPRDRAAGSACTAAELAVEEIYERRSHAVYARLNSVADAIIAARATTIDGLMVKARVVLWCYCGNVHELIEESADAESFATSERCAYSIAADLLSLKGA